MQHGKHCHGSHSPACCLQLEKSRHGAKVRFIDHHTINNLDWYPDVKKELQDPKVKEELNITLPKPRSQKHHEAWQAGVRAASNKQGGIPILHRCCSPSTLFRSHRHLPPLQSGHLAQISAPFRNCSTQR